MLYRLKQKCGNIIWPMEENRKDVIVGLHCIFATTAFYSNSCNPHRFPWRMHTEFMAIMDNETRLCDGINDCHEHEDVDESPFVHWGGSDGRQWPISLRKSTAAMLKVDPITQRRSAWDDLRMLPLDCLKYWFSFQNVTGIHLFWVGSMLVHPRHVCSNWRLHQQSNSTCASKS